MTSGLKDKDNETRELNRSVVQKFFEIDFEKVSTLFTEDGVKIIPWYPQKPAIWRGRDAIHKNGVSNKELFAGWKYDKIEIYGTDDPNHFWVLCNGSGEQFIKGAPKVYSNSYVLSFLLQDGLIKEFKEFFSPLGLYESLGIDVPPTPMPTPFATD